MKAKNQMFLVAMVFVLALSQGDPNCANPNDPNCIVCNPGYFLRFVGVCIYGDPKCLQFTTDGSGHCLTCKNNFILTSNRICIEPTSICSFFSNDGNGVCLACIQSFTLVSNTCVSNSHLNCAVRAPAPSINCLQCQVGYYINGVTGLCTWQGNPYCLSFIANGGDCLTCISAAFLLINGICVSKPDLFCSRYVAGTTYCQVCYPCYYINGNGVTGRCVAWNQFCASFTNDGTGDCKTCQIKSYVLVAGDCLPPSTIDPYCSQLAADAITCARCYRGFYINVNGDNKCVPANQLCAFYNMLGGGCTFCYYPYRLSGEDPNTCVYP